MAVGDLYQVRLIFGNASTGELLSTGFHIRQDLVTAPGMAQVGTAVKNWWNIAGTGTAEKGRHPDEVTLDRVTLRRVVPDEPIEQSYTTGLPIPGTSAGDPLPPQTAILASLRTALIGRSYRGRMFLPPTTESFLSSGASLTAIDAQAVLTQLDGLRQEFANPVLGIGAAWVVLSRQHNGAPVVPPIGTEVTQIKVDRILRTQRRRADERAVYV